MHFKPQETMLPLRRQASEPLSSEAVSGAFVSEGGETWYCIDGPDALDPFFMTLASDSDLWAFVSSTGSLTAGRGDAEGAFLPYETVDKIHARWEHTGPRTWILIETASGLELWEPFAQHPHRATSHRSIWKNVAGTRIRFCEEHPDRHIAFQYEWSTASPLGLIRTARIRAIGQGAAGNVSVRVLDGVLNLIPPGVGVKVSSTMSNLSDAYKWNESAAAGRLGLFTLYAQIWDRAEPKESFLALTAWHAGAPAGTRTLLSANQVKRFCQTGEVEPETLTRGRRGAFLVNFEALVDASGLEWHLVIDGPKSQVETFELAHHLASGAGLVDEIVCGRDQNTRGLNELLEQADAFQSSADPMAAAHHHANVLFNSMRGGVFADGTLLDRDDLLAFARQRHQSLSLVLAEIAGDWPARIEREVAIAAVRARGDAQIERMVLQYLPLTFSRRHGDPSRPWNQFSIKVRDAAGRRVLNYQGNWRDIFQNWEALLPSQPAYVDSMILTFLGAMSADGYNPYRIGRDGIDWEVLEPEDTWSQIGYWGDHQIIYLLKLLEAANAHNPDLLEQLWNRALFSFSDIPYRLQPHAQQTAQPKRTIRFDQEAHQRAHHRKLRIGGDGLCVCDADGLPILATLGEKLAIVLLAKAGSLVPGGGLWLHTQRPEWNDANNALVGNGLSVVTLAHLRRFLAFLQEQPCVHQSFALSESTLCALQDFAAHVRSTPLSVVDDANGRRIFLDTSGAILDPWRESAYGDRATHTLTQAPEGLLANLVESLLPLVDATLQCCLRDDGLYDSYNLVDFANGRASVARLYPMLEGQVAVLSCGLLKLPDAVTLLETMFASSLFTADRNSFMLYPDRSLPGFLQRNRLDTQALALPVVQALLKAGRTDLLQRQSDGTVRFSPSLCNREDLELAGSDLGMDLEPLVETYERILRHSEFTGRSGTMFGYEGLGCIYWHMVAKLLLAVQERVFEAADLDAPELPALIGYYRRVRDGLGYRKSVLAYGTFPADPYSHTPAEGGAQQPGMTGQVKEEILTRWGELGLRIEHGCVRIHPVLLDQAEIAPGGELRFTWRGVPYIYRRASQARIRVQRADGWVDCPSGRFDPNGVLCVEVDVCFGLDSP